MIKKMKKARKYQVGEFLELTNPNRLKDYRLEWCEMRYKEKVVNTFELDFGLASLEVTGKHQTPHVLRRSRATTMMNKGVPLINVRDYLGHQSLMTTEKYLGSSLQVLGDSMLKLGL